MAMRLDSVKQIAVGTDETEVDIGYRTCLLSNSGATTIYIREKNGDGEACSSSNGFAIPKGTLVQTPMQCRTLSCISSGAGGVLCILLGEDWH